MPRPRPPTTSRRSGATIENASASPFVATMASSNMSSLPTHSSKLLGRAASAVDKHDDDGDEYDDDVSPSIGEDEYGDEYDDECGDVSFFIIVPYGELSMFLSKSKYGSGSRKSRMESMVWKGIVLDFCELPRMIPRMIS